MKAKSRSTVVVCKRCGFATGPTSPGMADASMRRHSCESNLKRAAARRRRLERLAASGERRDCAHPRARHQHGTYMAYVLDRCRCRECRDANRVYGTQRVRGQLYGTWSPFIDAEPVRAHIKALTAAGLGLKRISALTGVSNATLAKIIYGMRRADGTMRPPTRRVKRETAAAILAVRAGVDNLGATVTVDGTGTRRRLQALVANGWSISRLCHEFTIVDLHRCLSHPERGVRASTARAVLEGYERLWSAAPPAKTRHERGAISQAIKYAAARSWVPPLAWDDETIDDPAAQPHTGSHELEDQVDPVVVTRLIEGWDWRQLGATRAEREAAAERVGTHNFAKQLGLRLGRDVARSA